MIGTYKSDTAFKSYEKAAKALPRGGPLLIMVLNHRGLPVLQYGDQSYIEHLGAEMLAAQASHMLRNFIAMLSDIRSEEPERIVVTYEHEVFTLERNGPFVFFMVWSSETFSLTDKNSVYLRRLVTTLEEDLT